MKEEALLPYLGISYPGNIQCLPTWDACSGKKLVLIFTGRSGKFLLGGFHKPTQLSPGLQPQACLLLPRGWRGGGGRRLAAGSGFLRRGRCQGGDPGSSPSSGLVAGVGAGPCLPFRAPSSAAGERQWGASPCCPHLVVRGNPMTQSDRVPRPGLGAHPLGHTCLQTHPSAPGRVGWVGLGSQSDVYRSGGERHKPKAWSQTLQGRLLYLPSAGSVRTTEAMCDGEKAEAGIR